LGKNESKLLGKIKKKSNIIHVSLDLHENKKLVKEMYR